MDLTTVVITSLFGVASFGGIVGGWFYASKDNYNSTVDYVMCIFMGCLVACTAMGILIGLFIAAPVVLFCVSTALAVVYKLHKDKRDKVKADERNLFAETSEEGW